MPFDPTMAAIRFGVGLSPGVGAPQSVDAMMALLAGPDRAAEAFAIPPFAQAEPSPATFRLASLAVRDAPDDAAKAAAEAARDRLREDGREMVGRNLAMEIGRSVTTEDGLRERLTRFWADHFTVRAVSGVARNLVSPYVEEAIRPNLTGRFGDMLKAAVTHPMMLIYLDQHLSVGPNSRTAERTGRGLNENLARELLELHTLGVGGRYDQRDVRELAELLTGLTYTARTGFRFRAQNAEPGAETVLGVSYGGGDPSLDDILRALDDIARHPDTARHIARKLAVHFIGPEPDTDLIDMMAARYLESDGRLLPVYEAMLRHDAAWAPEYRKVKPPLDFIASAMRALGVDPAMIRGASLQDVRRVIYRPMQVMGQTWQAPVGPDGWPEEDEAWVTPQGMAGRITWAMTAPQALLDDLPDPRDFVRVALGPTPPDAVLFAAQAAESRSDGIGVILASAAFQRR